METGKPEPGCLLKPKADVHSLHRLAGRTLHEVVQRSQNDDAIARRVRLEADIAVVAAGENLRLGKAIVSLSLLDDADEGLGAVDVPIDPPEVTIRQPFPSEDVRGGQDAPNSLDAGGGEAEPGWAAVPRQL